MFAGSENTGQQGAVQISQKALLGYGPVLSYPEFVSAFPQTQDALYLILSRSLISNPGAMSLKEQEIYDALVNVMPGKKFRFEYNALMNSSAPNPFIPADWKILKKTYSDWRTALSELTILVRNAMMGIPPIDANRAKLLNDYGAKVRNIFLSNLKTFRAHTGMEWAIYNEYYGADISKLPPYSINYVVTNDAPPIEGSKTLAFWSYMFTDPILFSMLNAASLTAPVTTQTFIEADVPGKISTKTVDTPAAVITLFIIQYALSDFRVSIDGRNRINVQYVRKRGSEAFAVAEAKDDAWKVIAGGVAFMFAFYAAGAFITALPANAALETAYAGTAFEGTTGAAGMSAAQIIKGVQSLYKFGMQTMGISSADLPAMAMPPIDMTPGVGMVMNNALPVSGPVIPDTVMLPGTGPITVTSPSGTSYQEAGVTEDLTGLLLLIGAGLGLYLIMKKGDK